MGFGLDVKVEAPKVAAPKVEAPKVDVAGAAAGAAAGVAAAAKGAVTGALGGVTGGAGAAAGLSGGLAGGIAGGLAGGISGVAKGAVAGVAGGLALSAVAGALADVSVSFKGGTEDAAMEPHSVLDANAGYEETKFEKGPVWIRVDLTPEKAKASGDTLHLHSASGAFDEKKPVSAFSESGPKTVDILFENAPMDQAYSLYVIGENGRAYPIFSDVPYGDLRKTKARI